MKLLKTDLIVLSALLLVAGAAFGQAGNPDYHFVRSEPPVIMEIDLGDVSYDFQGEATIPFTLRTSRAHIWLVVYTKDQDTPEGFGGPASPIAPNGALWRKGGIPNMVAVVDKGQFEEGSHTITWDGTDFEGNAVEPGDYTLYVIGLNDQDDANLVGILGNGLSAYGRGDVLLDSSTGQGWIAGAAETLMGLFEANHIVMIPIGENDFLENPTNFPYVFVPNSTAHSFAADESNVFRQWGVAIHDEPSQPDDENRTQVDPFTGETMHLIGNTWQGISAWVVEEDLSGAVPLESFGDENGQVPVITDNSNRFMGIRYHDGRIYVAHGDWGQDPPQSEVIVMNAQSGEILDALDVNEWFTTTGVDFESGEEVTGSNGPGCLYVDNSGIYLGPTSGGTGADSDGPNRGADFGLFMKMDFEGNPIWINERGDGFGDVISQTTADALGIAFQYQGVMAINAASNGFSLVSEENGSREMEQDHFGAVIGPDGAGLFHVDITNAPPSPRPWSSGIDMIHEGSAYDGIYIVVQDSEYQETHGAKTQIAHAPFRIAQAVIGTSVETAVEEVDSAPTPEQYALSDAYPNPFNPETTIEFALPQEGPALMMVYNIQGQKVKTLVNEVLPAGQYRAVWDGTDTSGRAVSSGVYLYRLRSGSFVETKRMSLLK